MSTTPNRSSHEDGNLSGTDSGRGGSRHDYHPPYEMGQKNASRSESRDADRRSPSLPNVLFRGSTCNNQRSDNVDPKDSTKETTAENPDFKSDFRELQQGAKYDSRGDDGKDLKHEKDTYSEHKGDVKIDKDGYSNWKDMKEQYRVKQHLDSSKDGLNIDGRDFSEKTSETVGENKVDNKGEDKFKDKERKRKEVRHWGEKREERETDRQGNEKKDSLKDKENDQSCVEPDKEVSHNVKEVLVEVPSKPLEHEFQNSELKKKDPEGKDRKNERDADVVSDRPDKRVKVQEKVSEDGDMDAEGGGEREREGLNIGVQQRKRMHRPRGSPQMGKSKSPANDNEGSQGKSDTCVVYKIGECMQELMKLWKEYEQSPTDEGCPTLDIRIPAEHVTATNRQVRGGQLWGTDVYTVDSDLVAVLMHTGYCRPTASPPPSTEQELRATIRVLPPKDCYISTLRNNVRSRAWGSAVGCSYRVERCCIMKKGGGIISLEPCLTHSSTLEPTLAPVAVERTMTTRASASNALRQQRFVREVTIQFNLCMEPWLKYSISAVADKGLKKPLFTSARLKKGEVLYVETHSHRFELCFNGERVMKQPSLTPTNLHIPNGSEPGKSQTHTLHAATNGEKTAVDAENTVVDTFRWSRCKRPLPQKMMKNLGIPLPIEHVEVLEENFEWDDISWLQSGAWIRGKVYHLARAHFLAPN